MIESGLNYTILQPSSFMQNVDLERVVSMGVLPAAYSSKTLQGYLDLQDLAEVARLVILDPQRLAANGVSADQVVAALRSQNLAAPVGQVTTATTERSIRLEGRLDESETSAQDGEQIKVVPQSSSEGQKDEYPSFCAHRGAVG